MFWYRWVSDIGVSHALNPLQTSLGWAFRRIGPDFTWLAATLIGVLVLQAKFDSIFQATHFMRCSTRWNAT